MKENRAKSFMYVCVGFLMVCIAVQVLTTGVIAQSAEPTTVATSYVNHQGQIRVVMSNGDVYKGHESPGDYWVYSTNVFEDSSPVSNTDSDLGDVKRAFR